MKRGRDVEEMGKKILAVFVWQQQSVEPQRHVNERKAFQRRGGGAGVEPSHGYQTSERRGISREGEP